MTLHLGIGPLRNRRIRENIEVSDIGGDRAHLLFINSLST